MILSVYFLTYDTAEKMKRKIINDNNVLIAVAQWLRCCATNWKVAGSIPLEISIHIKSFRSHYGTGVDSASNRNKYQEHFLGVKAAGA